ncbi:MAG: hypothetical protein Q7S75_00720 [bacterium]|nr:hypothetical protein [bacterium]
MITNHTSSSRFIAALMLVSLLATVLFSFTTVMHESDGRMQGDCPFSTMGVPLCPQNLVAAAVHHISAYQSLLNTPINYNSTILIVALLIIMYGIFMFFIRPPTLQPQLIGHFRDSPHSSARDRKTTRWLSLFEHSPSLV